MITYKYPPIYKYGFLLLVIYMFLKYQKIMSTDKLLYNSIVIVMIIAITDYIIIDNHPLPFDLDNNNNIKKQKQEFDDVDIEEIINSSDGEVSEEFEDLDL